jgi:hypothetical protein
MAELDLLLPLPELLLLELEEAVVVFGALLQEA